MAIDPRVVELLAHYQQRREQGQPVTPEELCRPFPELLPELRQRIQDLPALQPLIATRVETSSVTVAPSPPCSGSRYRPLRLHARGGLGEVFLARDDELDRDVALKRVQARHAHDAGSLRRFLREAEVTGRLEHPGVVPVYGLGQDAEGQPCYAMRFIAGDTLDAAVRRFHAADRPGRDPGERLLAFRQLLTRFAAVCNTLAYAHDQGFLHRDLKPGNIMLGDYGETLVVDWGLAKPFYPTEEEPQGGPVALSSSFVLHPSSLVDTAPGQVVGTPAYMSPEQAAGQNDRLGPASDIYSLGAILYTILTGRLPFHGTDLLAILGRVKAGDFPPPGQVKPGVPPALEAICLRAMALAPAHRYATALDLAAEAERWLADEPVRAYPERRRERLARWGRRHRTFVTSAAVLLGTAVVALAVGTGFIVRAWHREAVQKEQAEIAQHAAEVQADAAQRAHDEAETARQETLRKALIGDHQAVASFLAEARVLHGATTQPDRQQQALERIRRAAALAGSAREKLRQLGPAAGDLVRTEPHAWDIHRTDLATEATRWLTGIGLGPTRTVVLPPLPPESGPAVARSWKEVPKLYQGTQGWLDWTGDLAISPDGAQVAVAYAGGRELLIVPTGGGDVRHWPLPDGMASIRLGMYCEGLRFVAADRIEMSTREELVTWTGPNGKVQSRRRSPAEREEVQRRIEVREQARRQAWGQLLGGKEAVLAQCERFTASLVFAGSAGTNSQQVIVRRAGGKAGRVVLRTNERFDRMLFGSDPRHLYVLGRRDLTLVDVAQGLYTQATVIPPGANGRTLELLPCPGGVATLQAINGTGVPPLQLTLWNTVGGRVWKDWLPHDLPALCLDRADDGRLVSAGMDHVVRLWKGRQEQWAQGIPPRSNQLQSFPYPWWDFGSGDSPAFGVERVDLRDRASEGGHELNDPPEGSAASFRPRGVIDLYRPEDGRLLHQFPLGAEGRVWARSPDHRYAVVVAEEHGDQVTLDLWSLGEAKALGRLGTYPARRKAKIWNMPDEEVVPAISVLFSPAAHWLLLIRHAESSVEVWRLPQLAQVGKVAVPVPWVRAEFDPDERRLLLMGPSRDFPESRYVFAGIEPPLPCPPFIRVIDLATGTSRCDLQGLWPQENVNFMAFRFLEDRVVAVAFRHKPTLTFVTRTWDLTTGKRTELAPAASLNDPAVEFGGTQLALSPDRTRLLVVGYVHYPGKTSPQALAQLWDLSAGRLLRTGHFESVQAGELSATGDRTAIHLSARGQYATKPSVSAHWKWSDGTDAPPRPEVLWTMGDDDRWALWRGPDGMVLYDRGRDRYVLLEESRGEYLNFRAALSPDGSRFALEERHRDFGRHGIIHESVPRSGLWDVRTGRRLVAFAPHSFRRFDATGRWLSTVDQGGGEVRVWDARTGREAARLSLPRLRANSEEYGTHWSLIPWDLRGRHSEMQPIDVAVYPDGRRLAVLSQGVIQLWDLPARKPLVTVPRPGHLGPVLCVAQHAPLTLLSPPAGGEGRVRGAGLVASGGTQGVVLLWDRRTGRLLRPLLGHTSAITGLAFTPDGSRLASASTDGTIRLWHPDGRTLWTYRDPRPEMQFRCLAFWPRHTLLAAGTDDGRILLLDVERHALKRTLPTDSFGVMSLTFSGAGDRLAAGTAGGHVYLWRTGDWTAQRLDAGAAVPSVLFTPRGDFLLAGGRVIQVWDATSGRRLLGLEPPHGVALALALNESGKELFVATAQRSNVLVLDLDAMQRELKALQLGLPGYPWARP